MNSAVINTSINTNGLIWAIVSSLLLHVIIFVTVPNIEFELVKKVPDILKVELVKLEKPEPIAELIKPLEPEPIKPAQQKPKELKSEPIKKLAEPKPTQKLDQAQHSVMAEPKSEPKAESIQTEPATPTVITAAAKPDEKPAFVTPAPQPESANDDDVNAARNAYIKSVHQELKRNHRYPKMAERNGISGEVKVEIKFDKDGNMLSSSVIESSGNAALDEGALATVKRSNFKQYMKQILIGRIDTITVPIVFSLASN